ncbi:MAG: hypothetical protein ACLUJC_12685, partial [Clostridia bacterium]
CFSDFGCFPTAHFLTFPGIPDEVVMLVVFFGKAGVLADHDGLAGVDVLEHPDNENGLSVVSRVKPGKYPFERHE